MYDGQNKYHRPQGLGKREPAEREERSMIHYVLLKFKPGTDLDAAEKQIRETYEALDRELPFFHDPKTYRCCVERDSNADIMSIMRLDAPEDLPKYLQHPLHMAMGKSLNPSIVTRISFDHPDD